MQRPTLGQLNMQPAQSLPAHEATGPIRATSQGFDLKRACDLGGSLAMLLVASPILLVAAIAIYATDRGPVFYRQTRAGRDGEPFALLKFRSMRVNDLSPVALGQIRPEHPMVTWVGRWIRRFKIDELPQLVNVLLGDMSLIGPRPTVPEQVAEYTEFQFRRLHTRPGLSGWAQINGGIELSWPDRILLDVWYVEHRSWRLDLKIFLLTMPVVFLGESAHAGPLEQAIASARREGQA